MNGATYRDLGWSWIPWDVFGQFVGNLGNLWSIIEVNSEINRKCGESVSHLVVSDSLWPHGLYNLPGSLVHGILQARILEWVAILFSRGSSWPRYGTPVSHTAGRFFIYWATRGAHKNRKEKIQKTNFSSPFSAQSLDFSMLKGCTLGLTLFYVLIN